MEDIHFTTYNPKEMNTRFFGVYSVAKQPFFYGREQNKGLGIEFEPQSKFDGCKVDLPNISDFSSADGDEQETEDEDYTEYEGEDTEGVVESDLPRYRDLVRNKKLELKAQYGKAHLTMVRECKNIKVPELYTDRECVNVPYPCPTFREPFKVCQKQICSDVPKTRFIDKEVCANVPKFVWGWRKKWREFKRDGGLAQLKMQSKGLAPIVPPFTPTVEATNPTVTSIIPKLNVGTVNQIPLNSVNTRVYQKMKAKEAAKDGIMDSKPINTENNNSINEGSDNGSSSKESKFLGMPRNIGIAVTVVGVFAIGFGVYKLIKK